MMSKTEKLLRWFLFSVPASLVPLALTYFSHRIDRHAVRLEMLLGRGELLLVTTTLGAAALGELIPASRENAVAKVLAGGASVLMIVISRSASRPFSRGTTPIHGPSLCFRWPSSSVRFSPPQAACSTRTRRQDDD